MKNYCKQKKIRWRPKKYNLINNKATKVKIIGPVTISSKKKLVDVVATKSVMEFIK